MENLIEIVIAIIVIVFSALWDKGKGNAGTTGNDESADLVAIEEFFKKQNKNQQSTPPTSSSDSTWKSEEAASFGDGKFDTPPAPTMTQGAARQGTPKQKAQKKKEKKPKPTHVPVASSYGGECLDEGPSLENAGFSEKGLLSSSSSFNIKRYERPPARIKWDRKQLLNLFMMNEIMNRYNVNRIFERIPGRRSD